MNKLRILVADDHEVVREGLRLLLDAQPDMQVVGEAGDGREACERAQALEPDVVVLDLSMPQMNGLQAAEQLKSQSPRVAVLVLTMHEDESYLRELVKAHVSGYVLKRSAGQDLVAAIRKVAAGLTSFDQAVAGAALVRMAGNLHVRTGEDVDLTEREAKVARLIAWGYGNKEIAGQLGVSVKSIENYRTKVGAKLGTHNRADIVRYAVRKGWMKEE